MPRQPNSSPQSLSLLRAFLAEPQAWHYGYSLSLATHLKSGTLYPMLMRLQSQGLLEARWGESDTPGRPQRHLYRLSRAGLAAARAAMLQPQRARPSRTRLKLREQGAME